LAAISHASANCRKCLDAQRIAPQKILAYWYFDLQSIQKDTNVSSKMLNHLSCQ